jgi:SAM-dependent methyltransferase
MGSPEERWAREIEHHRRIADEAEVIWNWDSPAGRGRARGGVEFFGPAGGRAPGRRALELGCGTGVFLAQVAASGAELVGLDLSSDLLERARGRLQGQDHVRLVRGNAENLPFPAGAFDAVYGSSVLHHLDLARALAEAQRVLRPGGAAVFAEPNIVNPQVAFMFHVGPTKRYFGVSPDEMAFSRFRAARALRQAGFAEISVKPFDFLHPGTPPAWIERVARAGAWLERVPLVREICGSLLLVARRP